MSFPNHSQRARTRPVQLLAAALLGVAAATLLACGSSNSGLIPAASAGPLQSDFEAVARAAQSGNGSCAATESALGKTEQEFLALPASLDAGLRKRLSEGIANLRKVALEMCAQPSPTATTGTTTPHTTSTPTTATSTTPSTTPSTPTGTGTATTPTTTTPPNNGGGTPAPEGSEESQGKGKGKVEAEGKGEGKGKGEGNNDGGGGASPEGGR